MIETTSIQTRRSALHTAAKDTVEHHVEGLQSCSVTRAKREPESTASNNRKDYENQILQSRLHLRIHSALQEIKHRRKQAKEASKMEKKLAKRSKNGVNNNTLSADSDSISISLEGSSSLTTGFPSSKFVFLMCFWAFRAADSTYVVYATACVYRKMYGKITGSLKSGK